MKRNGLVLSFLMALLLLMSMLEIAPPAKATTPQIVVSPDQGWYDTAVLVHGTGFAASAQVIVTWEGLDYWQVFAFTDAEGNFSVSFNVPDSSIAGNRIVTAIDEYANTATDVFTLFYVYVDAGSIGIKTPKQRVVWHYDAGEFYCDSWKFYHDSYDGWYNLMNDDEEGIYLFRIRYGGVTYVFDLGSKRYLPYNAYPQPLVEQVVGFAITDVNRAQGTIHLYDPSGQVLLVTVIIDIITPQTLEDHYTMLFTIVAGTALEDLAFYSAYNLDVYDVFPNCAYYENSQDAVYQYYGPSDFSDDVSERYKCYAGFASVIPSSTHHDAVIHYSGVQLVKDLGDYDFNYRDNDIANGDYLGQSAPPPDVVDCGVGLQWTIGPMNSGAQTMIPSAFASSDETLDAFKACIRMGKLFAHQYLLQNPVLTLSSTQGYGSSVVTAYGGAFMPYSKVDVYFSGILVGSFDADYRGAFEGIFTVPTSVSGFYSVTAVDEYGLEASATFQVLEQNNNNQILDRLDELDAKLSGLITTKTGEVLAKIDTTEGTILFRLDTLDATLAGHITNAKGEIILEITTVAGNLQAKLADINATVSGLITTGTGEVLAKIDTAGGTILSKLDTLDATLTGLVTDAKGEIILEITTLAGDLQVKLDDVSATLTGLITTSKDEVLASIDTTGGTILSTLDTLDATLTGLVTDAKGEIILEVTTALGNFQTNLDDLSATLSGLITTSTGEVLAKIDTAGGTILSKLETLNSTLIGLDEITAIISTELGIIKTSISSINGRITTIDGRLVTIETNVGVIKTDIGSINGRISSVQGGIASINTALGPILTELSNIAVKITSIEGNMVTVMTDIGDIDLRLDQTITPFLENIEAKLSIVDTTTLQIESMIGNVDVKLDDINAHVTDIEGDIVTITTDIGTIRTDLDNVEGSIVAIKNDMVTVKTKLGEVEVSLTNLNAEIAVTNNHIATIKTDLETITGKVTSIQEDIVTIETDVGTLKTTAEMVKNETDLRLPLIVLALIAATGGALILLRKPMQKLINNGGIHKKN